MKKLGLTVAEILITTTIVGLISAITIPTLVNNSQQKVLVNSLPVMITNIEKTLQNIMLKENVTDLSETELWKNYGKRLSSSHTNDTVLKSFSHDIGIFNKAVGGNVKSYYNGKMYTINNTLNNIMTKYTYTPFEFKNGSVVFINGRQDPTINEDRALENGLYYTKHIAQIIIDVNGKQKPNTIGRDIFYFYLNEKGKLVAYGSYEFALASILSAQDGDPNNYTNYYWTTNCSDTEKGDGSYCTGRLVENDFKMDY